MENRNSYKKYKQEKISFGKAREIAGVTSWHFQDILNEKNIEINYSKEDLEDDIKALE